MLIRWCILCLCILSANANVERALAVHLVGDDAHHYCRCCLTHTMLNTTSNQPTSHLYTLANRTLVLDNLAIGRTHNVSVQCPPRRCALRMPPLAVHVATNGSVLYTHQASNDYKVQLIEDARTSLLLLELAPTRVPLPSPLPWRIALASVVVTTTFAAMLLR